MKKFGSGVTGIGVLLLGSTLNLFMTVTSPAFTCISANRKPENTKKSKLNIGIQAGKTMTLYKDIVLRA
jgi:hypothetical protein